MKRIIIILTLTTCLVSCKKNFLEAEDHSIIALQDYVKDLNTTGEYLNGVQSWLATTLYKQYATLYPEVVADNIKPLSPITANTALGLQYSWAQQADETSGFSTNSKNCNGTLYDTYRIVTQANYVLDKIAEYKDQDNAKANGMRGRALFIRALSHFFALHVFAQAYNFTPDGSHPGIAYVTSSYRFEPATRLSVREVYDRVIADLNEAATLIPAGITSTLEISRNAAKAILARVYLFKGDYAAAKSLAREISMAVPIMTGSNYPARLYTAQETEALLQLSPGRSTSIGNTSINQFPGVYFRTPIQFYATADIANMITERPADSRKAWVTKVGTNWTITKFPTGVVADVTPAAQSYYMSVVRSSEMYLTAAEAYANLNMSDSAWFFLDAIRKRADATAPSSTATGPALLDSIYKERRKELAFEGLRMFDLMRWKKPVNRLDFISPDLQTLPYPSNKAISPIPTTDVALGGMMQNPGY